MSESRDSITVPTTWGDIVVELENGKVVACTLPFHDAPPRQTFRLGIVGGDPISSYIQSVFSGRPAKTPPLGKLEGTIFQQDIWTAISRIKPGQTKSYGELAVEAGRPKAFRAAGAACGKNPVPLFIPCHRVVGSQGQLGGFSSGLAWKKLLLGLES